MIELKDGVSFNDIFVREKCQEFFKASTSVNKNKEVAVVKSVTDEKVGGTPAFRVSPCDKSVTLKEVVGRAKVQLIPRIVDESVELLTAILDGREADWRIVEVENGQTLVVHALQTVRERKQIKHGGRGGWVTGTSYRPVTLRVDFAQGDQVIVEEENAEEKSRPMRTMTSSPVAATA